ncbi:MAG: hypothetical protein HRT57_00225 [Crocinitomicaceae bacterium]|nr:hypothetical protein [Crocinitomicaceae bacterium]
MKLRLLTLFSIIVVLAIKTYSINAQDGVIDDEDVELLTRWELKNKSDSVYHEKHVHRIVSALSKSPYIAEDKITAVKSSEIYHEYSKLKKVANEYELNKLLVHPSPIIRVYSHRALMEKNYEPNTLHLEVIANDSTNIEWMRGDVMIKTTVMEIVAENMFRLEEKDTLVAENILF